jgi:hypothetical protein
MGRILDLCAEIASTSEEGAEGLVLGVDERERLGQEWSEDEIDDALALVHESLLQSELVDAADSLNATLLEVLSASGDADAFAETRESGARLEIETVGRLARRVSRLEEVLDVFRDEAPPDRTAFEALRRRLADLGIEEEMASEDPVDEAALGAYRDDDADDDEPGDDEPRY